jgi:SEFIR domain
VSYAHDDDRQIAAVRELSEFPRGRGVNTRLDLSAAERRQEWPTWMAVQFRTADFVLAVASPAYKLRCDGEPDADEGREGRFEARLIREDFYRDRSAGIPRFLPVLLPGMSAEHRPDILLPESGTSYAVASLTVASCEALLRVLTGQPAGRH